MKTLIVALLTIVITITVASKETQAECDKLKKGAPRGIMCLHCLIPENAPIAEKITNAVINSCREKVGLAFVIDGSFGDNLETITQSLDRIIAQGDRKPFAHFYMINGPAQRRWAKNIFPGFGQNFSPQKFRILIKRDQKYQESYKEYISKLLPTIDHLAKNDVNISITPVLEDNLNDAAFRSISKLTKEVFKDYNIKYFRNPCPDCFYGNTVKIPKGAGKELHHLTKYLKTKNGIVSNDGWGYVYFKGEKKQPIKRPYKLKGREEKALTLDEISPFVKVSDRLNNTFLLWISKYQQTLPGAHSVAPDTRKYPMPTDREIEELATFIGR